MSSSVDTCIQPLTFLSQARRQELAKEYFDSMSSENVRALDAFRTVVEAAVAETQTNDYSVSEKRMAANNSLPAGYFDAQSSMKLLTYPRVSGFLNAIRTVEPASTAVDIGTGASAVLALATALYHPRCRVEALEISPHAAASARKVVEIFGLSNRIDVKNVDAFDEEVKPTDLVVSETFHMALGYEKGALLLHRYADEARTLLPARAAIAGAITHAGNLDQNFSHIDIIDFRNLKDKVQGVLPLEGDSKAYQVLARSILLTDSGIVIVAPQQDPITSDDYIGTFSPPPNHTGEQRYVSFSYSHSDGAPKKYFPSTGHLCKRFDINDKTVI